MSIVVAALLMAAPCLDPDENTASGQRALQSGIPCNRYGKEPPKPPEYRGQPPIALQNGVKSYLDFKLYDGASARYKWLPGKLPGVVCGAVNAKNRMGAYTGFALFYGHYEIGYRVTSVTVIEDDDEKNQSLFKIFCV